MSYQSFANLNYDKCALDKKDQENTSHFNWTVDKNYGESNTACFVSASPFSHFPLRFSPSNVIQIESDLRGQNFKLSKCPELKYNPSANCTECEKCNEGLPCGCPHCIKRKQEFLKDCDGEKNNFLIPEYTRNNKSCNKLSGITINRFEYLCEDLQDMKKIQDNGYIGTSTRLAVRDSYESINKKKL
jgi:hypothetical protein